MELDREANMKLTSKTGIGKIIQDDAVQQPERRRKNRGLGSEVGLGLRVKRDVWVALHERAIQKGATVTQMIVDWLNQDRAGDGLPPV
jgi:hypothetical protein